MYRYGSSFFSSSFQIPSRLWPIWKFSQKSSWSGMALLAVLLFCFVCSIESDQSIFFRVYGFTVKKIFLQVCSIQILPPKCHLYHWSTSLCKPRCHPMARDESICRRGDFFGTVRLCPKPSQVSKPPGSSGTDTGPRSPAKPSQKSWKTPSWSTCLLLWKNIILKKNGGFLTK